MLAAKGRLALRPTVEEWVEANLEPPVFLQPLTPGIALRSSELEDFNGDPADGMIVATALVLRQPLITGDEKIIEWFQARPDLKDAVHAI